VSEGDLPPVSLTTEPSAGWLALAAGRKGGFPPAAHRLLTGVADLRFAEIRDDAGNPLAIARGTVTGPGRWLSIMLVEVVPEARRRGLARRVVRGLARWADGIGASRAFLQVAQPNTAAVALYARLGFRTHHTYLTRLAPTGDEGDNPC
jgi:ribosomal protein S18 acetylase RimI-like enzyme